MVDPQLDMLGGPVRFRARRPRLAPQKDAHMISYTEGTDDRRVVKVLTRQSRDDIVAKGYTGDWRADGEKLAHCKYVICVRNRRLPGELADVEHGHAFLIGKIYAVIDAADSRWKIMISEYTYCDEPDMWASGAQNPVRYLTIAEAEKQLKRGFDEFQFAAVPEPLQIEAKSSTENVKDAKPLTIPEAKAGLALTLGIREDQIEIVIHA